MKFKRFLFIPIVFLSSLAIWAMEPEIKEYDEGCFSRIQSHLSSTLFKWGEITSKTPIESDISKNILKTGIYVIHKETKEWMFFDRAEELYISGYCEEGNPLKVKTGRMKTAMNQINKIPAFTDTIWKTLKEKEMTDHIRDFEKRGILLKGDKFDSTNYGHTEQAFLSDLLDLEKVDKYPDCKVVVAMSSSNITCDFCASSLTFSVYNNEFYLKDRVMEYFKKSDPIKVAKDEVLEWSTIPEVSIVFSSYLYKKIDTIKKIGHNKTWIF